MQKPFEDLIVLDLSRYLLGAYTSLFFADLGDRSSRWRTPRLVI